MVLNWSSITVHIFMFMHLVVSLWLMTGQSTVTAQLQPHKHNDHAATLIKITDYECTVNHMRHCHIGKLNIRNTWYPFSSKKIVRWRGMCIKGEKINGDV